MAVTTTERRIESGEIGLRIIEAGPEDGEVVLLIHGWPDSSRLWRHQIDALAEAGYRVVAPDMRGFGESDRPDDVNDYNLLFILADATAVLDAVGAERAHVVGHDWGAAVAWMLASFSPDRVQSLTVLSVGHPLVRPHAGMAQMEKSFYMLLFQFEGIAEQWLSDDDWANMRTWTGAPPEFDTWVKDLSRPGALTASLNWYRANVPPASLLGHPVDLPKVTIPTMGVMGDRDFALTVKQMTASEEMVDAEWRFELLDGIDHWIPLETPDKLNGLLLDWLGSKRP